MPTAFTCKAYLTLQRHPHCQRWRCNRGNDDKRIITLHACIEAVRRLQASRSLLDTTCRMLGVSDNNATIEDPARQHDDCSISQNDTLACW